MCVLVYQVTSLKVEPIIRGGIHRFTDMVGQLWCSLADYHIRAAQFERVSPQQLLLLLLLYSKQARDIYEEAIHSVITVRDFTQVFDAYSQFEESMIQAKMEATSEKGLSEEGPLIN